MIRADDKHATTSRSWIAQWPRWIGYAAALWSLIYGAMGLYWMLGGPGFPFGKANDTGAIESLLGSAQVESGAPIIVTLGLVATLIALIIAGAHGRGLTRKLFFIFAWLCAATLLIVIPDRRVLMAVAYAPIFIIGAPFHWPPVSFSKAIPWPVINQLILMLGGLLWAFTALSYQRRTRKACVHCGRLNTKADAKPAQGAMVWSKWSVAVAVAAPVLYAATRWAWALGIPLGISEEFLREGQASGLWLAGAGLASVAVGGAILTLGLVQRWGEIFPRWMIGLAGKQVPPMLAIIPASLVSLIVTSAGLEYVRLVVTSAYGDFMSNWTTMGPELLWPIWGVALAIATAAYYYRRRGSCKHCGQH
ncbi:hypothetical protein [Ktedonospora formicarum]|uniref:Uncharacterized protein n=1 Tax=Ktedonospora formicarum TaxID=2778364 RepID=A0A8J3I3W6_9CHLR|nr:hypothetical protein [Ktedonospora formicarum]GHO46343.1 hypothetical protein KSX_45060 [Ktedonospora formicarum]